MQDSITIDEMFREKMRENPSFPAVIHEGRRVTREELNAMAGTIAAMLPEGCRRVGIVMDHGTEMIAAIFAVLRRGAAYVPAEPFFPDERIRFMMEDAGAETILTQMKYRERLNGFRTIPADPGRIAAEKTAGGQMETAAASGEDLAYILYTSGSTGAPKGVAVRNRNVCRYVDAFRHEFQPDEKDTMLQYSVCSFDIFVEEVFTTLLSGAVLAIPSEEDKKDIRKLMEFVERNHVTEISGFPYLLQEMNHLEKIPESLRLLISGGDVLRAFYVDRLLDQAEVYNTYGPSETTVCASYYRCSGNEPLPDGTYPVGKPVLGTQISVMDGNLNPLGCGQEGELCISGGGVSAGYIGNRAKENEAFVRQSDGTVLYRSGDLGYLRPDGNFVFLHRMDTQVMILGKRVETAEVESVLSRCPEIAAAVVKAYDDEQHLSYLVAYIVLQDREAALSTIRKEMARFLPSYMIPEFFVCMPELPLNANGKVDAGALPVVLKTGNLS